MRMFGQEITRDALSVMTGVGLTILSAAVVAAMVMQPPEPAIEASPSASAVSSGLNSAATTTDRITSQ